MSNQEHLKILKSGVPSWNKWRKDNPEIEPNLAGFDLSNQDLKGIDLSPKYIKNGKTTGLHMVDYVGACLEKTKFLNSNLQNAVLYGADLKRANLLGANLQNADLSNANLENAILVKSNLENAKLNSAKLQGANLSVANMNKACVAAVQYNRLTRCRGIDIEACFGSPRFKRYAQDIDYLEELHSNNKILFNLWLIFADCGRTPWRWLFWSIALALYFGANFYLMGPESFRISEPDPLPFNFWTMMYYSIVTFTTLGFGDITPKTTTAAMWIMAEVIIGYIMLGGLISIFASIIARRS